MEDIQLSVEAKLYDQPVEKLKEICQHLKITVEADLTKSRLLQKIRTEIEKMVDNNADDLEQFLLQLENFCEGNHEESEAGPDYHGEVIQARKDVEEMTKKFAELMELQQEKLQEAEEKYNEALRGKRVFSPATGVIFDGKNLIRIKDFRISGSVSSEKNRLPFSSLSKQMESALQKGYSEADIIHGVINAVSPSLHLRTYLESIISLTLQELRKVLRSHYGEKSSKLNLAVAAENERANKMSTRKRTQKLAQINVTSAKSVPKEKPSEGQGTILANLNALKADLNSLKEKEQKKVVIIVFSAAHLNILQEVAVRETNRETTTSCTSGRSVAGFSSPNSCNSCFQDLMNKQHFKCGSCELVIYCGKTCQKRHWSSHKLVCKAITTYEKENNVSDKVKTNFVSHVNPKEYLKITQLVGEKFLADCVLNGNKTQVLWDTGSQISILSQDFLLEQFPSIEVKDHVPFLVTNDKLPRTTVGYNVIAKVVRANGSSLLNCHESNIDKQNIASNFVESVQLSFSKNDLETVHALIQCMSVDHDYLSEVKSPKQPITVQRNHCARVSCRENVETIEAKTPVLFEPDEACSWRPGLEVSETLLTVPKGSKCRINIQIRNTTDHSITLKARTVLGRLSLVSPENEQLNPQSHQSFNLKDIREAQERDKVIAPIVKYKSSSHTPSTEEKHQLSHGSNEKFYPSIYRELHDENGHLGSERVFDLASQRFYWPHTRADMEHYTTKVCKCLKQRHPNKLPRVPMQSIVTTQPFEVVALHFLHLQRTSGGFEYVLVVINHITHYDQAHRTRDKSG
eukprot:gene2035-2314_t